MNLRIIEKPEPDVRVSSPSLDPSTISACYDQKAKSEKDKKESECSFLWFKHSMELRNEIIIHVFFTPPNLNKLICRLELKTTLKKILSLGYNPN